MLQACAQRVEGQPWNVWGTSQSDRALGKTLHEYTFPTVLSFLLYELMTLCRFLPPASCCSLKSMLQAETWEKLPAKTQDGKITTQGFQILLNKRDFNYFRCLYARLLKHSQEFRLALNGTCSSVIQAESWTPPYSGCLYSGNQCGRSWPGWAWVRAVPCSPPPTRSGEQGRRGFMILH